MTSEGTAIYGDRELDDAARELLREGALALHTARTVVEELLYLACSYRLYVFRLRNPISLLLFFSFFRFL